MLRVKEAILQNPEHFNMDRWHCNTDACIAGWIVLHQYAKLESKPLEWVSSLELYKTETYQKNIADFTPVAAEKILGIVDHEETTALFYSEDWHRKFLSKIGVNDVDEFNPNAKQTADYIDWWIEYRLPYIQII